MFPVHKTTRRQRWAFFSFCALVAFVIGMAVIDRLFPPPLNLISEEQSTIIYDKEGLWLGAYPTTEGRWRFETKIDQVDPHFVSALIHIEDKRFWDHFGVDPLAFSRAIGQYLASGRVKSGGSTITMQLARLLEPRPRTVKSKLIEMFRAMQIELRLSKQQILESYLMMAPYGGNLEGVRAASLAYFGKEPAYLNYHEQALLIALPQSPEKRRPDRNKSAALKAVNRISIHLVKDKVWPTDLPEIFDSKDYGWRRFDMPRTAYHATYRLPQTYGDIKDIHTTLSKNKQARTKRQTVDYLNQLNIPELAASVIMADLEDNSILVYCGNVSRSTAGSWINLAKAKRSPGSTLKPFIYGLALDEGLIHPDAPLTDKAMSFSGYSPKNFDGNFYGEVTLASALQHSLNLPAVDVLNRLDPEKLLLEIAAAKTNPKLPARKSDQVGLAIGLGGLGLSLEELTMLYAGLARGGRISKLQMVLEPQLGAALDHGTDESHDQNYRLVSGETATLIANILKNSPSVQGRVPEHLTIGTSRIAFKTGSSYGGRDSWALGFNARYVIGVWIGKANGQAIGGGSGRKFALPLLMSLFDTVGKTQENASPLERDSNLPIPYNRVNQKKPIKITFPPDQSVLAINGKRDAGYVLVANRDSKEVSWYLDGQKIEFDQGSARNFFKPTKVGFYVLSAFDKEGNSDKVYIRVVETLEHVPF